MQPIDTEVLARLDTPPNRVIGTAMLTVVLGGLVFYVARTVRRRSEQRRLHATIASIGVEHLCNVLVPDGMGGAVHVDYLLLTSRGIVVIDRRDVRGNIFGGDQMTQWTVMSGANRQTFPNPQHALYDRVAIVKQIAGDVPVEGRILFARGGRFPKGLPRWTLMMDSLRTEFPPPDLQAVQSWMEGYREAWTALTLAVNASPLRPRQSFIAEVFRS